MLTQIKETHYSIYRSRAWWLHAHHDRTWLRQENYEFTVRLVYIVSSWNVCFDLESCEGGVW